jgi:disulfide bond formation protein DsbB
VTRLAHLSALFREPGPAALIIFVVAALTVGGAWIYQSLGYIPCELCLKERIPYYAALAVAPLTFLVARQGRAGASLGGLTVLALLFLGGAALAFYHSGVEWRIFPGPSDCSGDLMRASSTEEFLAQLRTVKPVRCDEAALRILGLSLANWNVMISAFLAAVALRAAVYLRRAS